MEGKQHRKGVLVLQEVAKEQGWHLKINCHERGRDGWKFFEHGVKVDWQKELWTPIADCFVIITGWKHFLDLGDSVTRTITIYREPFPHVLEVYGMKPGQGHSSTQAVAYDARRANWFKHNLGILTTPFKTSELVGNEALRKEQILEAIRHTLESGQIRQL